MKFVIYNWASEKKVTDEEETGWITAIYNKISPKKEITEEQAMKLIEAELV